MEHQVQSIDGAHTQPGLTPRDIQDFQSLMEQHCGLKLEHYEAWRRANQLIALYRMLMGPIPEDPGVRT